MTRSPANLPFFRIGPASPVSPVLLSVPHAGRDYRPELLGAARLSKAQLETLEDRLVDRLVWHGFDPTLLQRRQGWWDQPGGRP